MNGYRICDIYTQDICNGILFNHRKESNIGIYDKVDGFKGVMLSEIKPDKDNIIWFASIWNITSKINKQNKNRVIYI